MRPVFYTNGTPSISTKINIDFDTSPPTAAAAFATTAAGTWDAGIWDTSLWGDALGINQTWQGANNVGRCGAPHVLANCGGFQLQWMSTDIIYRPGGFL